VTMSETNNADAGSIERVAAGDVFTFSRSDRLFATRRSLAERLEKDRTAIPLVADQLFHPDVPCDCVVRLGSLRVTRFLPDNREVTLAVLQAGNTFLTRAVTDTNPQPTNPPLTDQPLTDQPVTNPQPTDPPRSDSTPPDLYNLADIVLMAIGDTELWILPAEALADEV